MRKTTKAEKIAAYDNLSRYRSDTGCLHYLMAFKSRDCDLTFSADEDVSRDRCAVHDERSCPTCTPLVPEQAKVRVQGWGLARGDGGYVLVSAWTVDRDGDVCGESVVYAGSALDMPDGGDHYYASPMGLALRAASRGVQQESSARVASLVRS